ncbi:hypothetical protein Dsin_027778 [Dipteronia sinensis]|uniref:Reverse transcriptase domain-containing protein n=1 Tax=Dipteronia sinensis TaxID=43782 RepID=A0AAE0DUX0_9ROSI|nr:hypothetical protein Dsin_027778 [Dipteronia sinensis]
MDPSSAPGPDSFPGSFYQVFWELVSHEVVNFVQHFFINSWLLPNLNSNFVALIPKIPEACLISQFRPTVLANFLFKIIPKIMADRMGKIVSRIITKHEAAFIKGGSITDCIAMVLEGVHMLDRKAFGGNVGLKFDIKKAFDTISWDFVLDVLTRFGFHNTIVNWVKIILCSAKLSILINGAQNGYCACSRGVRQGDPLSPILFCLAEEVFSRCLAH